MQNHDIKVNDSQVKHLKKEALQFINTFQFLHFSVKIVSSSPVSEVS